MVVTTNAAAMPSPDPTASLQTIDSLINNTGPPNVALQVNYLFFYSRMYFINRNIIYFQRSSSVPDSQSQLSPVYSVSGSQMLNSSQISTSSNRQPPYSTLTQQSFPILK